MCWQNKNSIDIARYLANVVNVQKSYSGCILHGGHGCFKKKLKFDGDQTIFL